LTDFDKFGMIRRLAQLNITIFKLQDGSSRHLQKIEKCNISKIVKPTSAEFGVCRYRMAIFPLKVIQM